MFDPNNDGMAVRNQLDAEHKFVVLYAGAHGPANDLDMLVDAARLLRNERRILFVSVGDGKDRPRLLQKARELDLSNIQFVPPVAKDRLAEYLGASDVCVATLRNIPMFDTTYPNKIFDYMAAGRPTLLAIDGVIRKVIEESDGGIFVPPGDASALARAIQQYAQDSALCIRQGANARAHVEKHFSREVHADVLESLLLRLVVARG